MPVTYFKGFRGGCSDLRREGMDLRESSQSGKCYSEPMDRQKDCYKPESTERGFE